MFLSGRTIKQVDVVAMAAAKKKLAPSLKKNAAAMSTLPSKRSRPNAEMAGDAPRAKKRVKKLEKKWEREIHVISSQTTGTTTPSTHLISSTVKVSVAV